MENPFSEHYNPEEKDEALVNLILRGDKSAFDKLILRHQGWIYNIALKMVWEPEDARDVTQEVLLKLLTKLSTFKAKSEFRTWLYRIVTNHILNMKKSPAETQITTFSNYGAGLDSLPDLEIPDDKSLPEHDILVEEAKIGCMSAMLICLDREQRLVFTLGEILGVNDRIGAEILDIEKGTYRQRLARAREQLYNFMNNKCGLIRKENPCRCHKKTKAFIDAGYVTPDNLKFKFSHLKSIRETTLEQSEDLHQAMEYSYQKLFRDHPYQEPDNYPGIIMEVINQGEFKNVFNL